MQLLLPNMSFAQHTNWFQLTHGRALAGESSHQEGCAVPMGGTPHFGDPQLAHVPGREWQGEIRHGESFEPLRVRKYNQIPVCLFRVCGELTSVSREGTLIADILRRLQRQAIAQLIIRYS